MMTNLVTSKLGMKSHVERTESQKGLWQ